MLDSKRREFIALLGGGGLLYIVSLVFDVNQY